VGCARSGLRPARVRCGQRGRPGVLARIIEPSSKLDAARVLEEIGIQPCSYPTLKRRLPVYARPSWRQALAAACAAPAGLSAASLVLFDWPTRPGGSPGPGPPPGVDHRDATR
jgi:hypothetical protein